VTLARTGRLLLLVAFLAAQQAALAHDVWHAAKATPDKSQLCDFHVAFGTVSGALNGIAPSSATIDVQHVPFVSTDSAVITAHRLSPSSRGPPSLF
jgi:hypothetical protein